MPTDPQFIDYLRVVAWPIAGIIMAAYISGGITRLGYHINHGLTSFGNGIAIAAGKIAAAMAGMNPIAKGHTLD